MTIGMRIRRRLLWTLALGALMALSVAPLASAQVKTQIHLGVFAAGPTWERAAQAFNAQSETIEVISAPLGVSWPGMPEFLVSRIAAGAAPDVVLVSPENYADLYSAGLLLDLKPYMDRDASFDPDRYWPAVIRGFERDGRMFAFPPGLHAFMTYYNKRLFAEAGVAPLAAGHTQEDLLETARLLTAGDDQKGLGIYWWLVRLFPYVWANGGEIFVDGTPAFTSPTWVSTIERLAELQNQHDAFQPVGQNAGAWFQQGKLGMVTDGTWQIRRFRDALGEDVGIATFAPGSEDHVTAIWPDALAATSSTEHPAAVWEFIHWVAREGAGIIVDWLTIPVERNAAAEAMRLSFEAQGYPLEYLTTLQQSAMIGRVADVPPGWNDIINQSQAIFVEIGSGEVAPAIGLERIQALAETIVRGVK